MVRSHCTRWSASPDSSPGRIRDTSKRAVEPRAFGSAPERDRDPLGGLHRRGVLPSTKRARPLDDALLLCLARSLLVRLGATDVPRTGGRLSAMLDRVEN